MRYSNYRIVTDITNYKDIIKTFKNYVRLTPIRNAAELTEDSDRCRQINTQLVKQNISIHRKYFCEFSEKNRLE